MAADHDPEVFLNTFERIATVAGWPQDQWALRLTPCLTGLAQKVVEALDLGEAADYDKVKQAILGTLNLSAEAYRKRFRELRLEPGRSPRAVGQEMKANARRWLQPEMHFAEQVVELVVLEQLVTTLEPALRSWVTSQQPLTLEDAVTLLEAYWEAEAIWGVAAVPPQKNGQGQKKGPWSEMEEDMAACLERGSCEDGNKDIPGPQHHSKTMEGFPAASLPLDMGEGAMSTLGRGGGWKDNGGNETLPSRAPSIPFTREGRASEGRNRMGRMAWEEKGEKLEVETKEEGSQIEEGDGTKRTEELEQAGVRGEVVGGEKVQEKREDDKRGERKAEAKRGEPPGWEWIWMENPWTGKWEKLMVPQEEAERRRGTTVMKPSYWGEKEAREWRRKIREERANIEREKREQARLMQAYEKGKPSTLGPGRPRYPERDCRDH
ncbi:uncharacterized protein LOC110090082 isoform X1 [Pogona vitticeps]